MAKLTVVGGDFAQDERTTYFMGSFTLFPSEVPDSASQAIKLGIEDIAELKIHGGGVLMTTAKAISGVVSGAIVGGASGGVGSAVLGAAAGGAGSAAGAGMAHNMRSKGRAKRFTVRFKDGRVLRAELDGEEIRLGTLDRMKEMVRYRKKHGPHS